MIVGSRLTESPWIYRALQGPHAEVKFAPVLEHADLRTVRRALDVGCGPGINTRHFAETAYLGIDISERYVCHARRRHGREFVAADATTFDFGKGTFDFILANSFFHHVNTAAARETLSRLSRALTPGGRIHILDLVYPERPGPARLLARWDRGFFVRPLAAWRGLFEEHFEPLVFRPYGLKLLGLTLWQMVYFLGRRRAGR